MGDCPGHPIEGGGGTQTGGVREAQAAQSGSPGLASSSWVQQSSNNRQQTCRFCLFCLLYLCSGASLLSSTGLVASVLGSQRSLPKREGGREFVANAWGWAGRRGRTKGARQVRKLHTANIFFYLCHHQREKGKREGRQTCAQAHACTHASTHRPAVQARPASTASSQQPR